MVTSSKRGHVESCGKSVRNAVPMWKRCDPGTRSRAQTQTKTQQLPSPAEREREPSSQGGRTGAASTSEPSGRGLQSIHHLQRRCVSLVAMTVCSCGPVGRARVPHTVAVRQRKPTSWPQPLSALCVRRHGVSPSLPACQRERLEGQGQAVCRLPVCMQVALVKLCRETGFGPWSLVTGAVRCVCDDARRGRGRRGGLEARMTIRQCFVDSCDCTARTSAVSE